MAYWPSACLLLQVQSPVESGQTLQMILVASLLSIQQIREEVRVIGKNHGSELHLSLPKSSSSRKESIVLPSTTVDIPNNLLRLVLCIHDILPKMQLIKEKKWEKEEKGSEML